MIAAVNFPKIVGYGHTRGCIGARIDGGILVTNEKEQIEVFTRYLDNSSAR